MSQTQDSATETAAENGTAPLVQLAVMVPDGVKWDFIAIAVRKKTTRQALLTRILKDFIAGEKAA